jgi:hypothetical protein
MNVEIAHKLIHEDPKHVRRLELTEIAEAVVLALVAGVTAWCVGTGVRSSFVKAAMRTKLVQ